MQDKQNELSPRRKGTEMNKANAKRLARQGITVGHARALLAKAKAAGLTGASRVNKGLTKQQAYDILSSGYEDSPDDRMLWGLAAQNILREFG